MSFKHLFSRALEAAPGRLHFAAHSHHLWPDASYAGQIAAWEDAAMLADHKWDKVMGPVWREAQRHVADELGLSDPTTIVFAPNTHDLIVRLFSGLPRVKPSVLMTLGEFHSFRRQAISWMLNDTIELSSVDYSLLSSTALQTRPDFIFGSQIQFNSGYALPRIEDLAELAQPDGPWVVIDGYHAFMAVPTDLSAVADKVFYIAGGYKYAMAGEGVAFLHAPHGFAPRPKITGWYAEFESLAGEQGALTYAPDARRFLGSTFDPSGLYRFNAVQRMLKAEGLTTSIISAHCEALKSRFIERCPIPGFALMNGPEAWFHAFGADEESRKAAKLERNPASQQTARFLAYIGKEQGSADRLVQQLREHEVVVDARNNVLRIGFGLYQDTADVDRLVSIIRKIKP